MYKTTIKKHIGMDYENEVYLQNFRTIGDGKLCQSFANVIKLSAQSAPLDFNPIKSMMTRSESGTTYLYSFDATKILKTKIPDFDAAHTTAVFDLTAGASTYPSIKLDIANNIVFTSKQYLGRYDGSNWVDNWKNLGTNDASYKRQIENFEDLTLIGNGNYLAGYSADDGSDFASAYVELPKGSEFASMCANRNLLIGVNKNNVGQTLLWNGWSDAWLSKVNYENTISTIKKYGANWLVFSGAYIWLTDGYSRNLLTRIPVDGADLNASQINYDEQVEIVNDLIIIGSPRGIVGLTRAKKGLYIYDISRREWYFSPLENKYSKLAYYDALVTSLCFDSWTNYLICGWYGSDLNSGKFISTITSLEYSTENSIYISPPIKFNGFANLKRVKVVLSPNIRQYYNKGDDDLTIDVYALYLSKNLWNYGQVSASATAQNQVKVDGTISGANDAEVGDIVWFLEGQNSDEKKTITAISDEDTANEVWTLDSNLSTNAEANCYFNILKGIKSQTITLTNKTITGNKELEFYFDNFYDIGCRLLIEVKGASYLVSQIEEIEVEYG
mgnify:CR=1 FL=1